MAAPEAQKENANEYILTPDERGMVAGIQRQADADIAVILKAIAAFRNLPGKNWQFDGVKLIAG